jgi:hypothetical protein
MINVPVGTAQFCDVPLMQHLSNEQFMTQLDRICRINQETPPASIELIDQRASCACGCGQGIALGRRFVDQAHYDRSKGLSQVEAERLIAEFDAGVPKRQLARDFGVDRATVKRLLRRQQEGKASTP